MKPPETKEEREQRKAIFIQRATKDYDTPQIRKEAEEMWEKGNPLPKEKKCKSIGCTDWHCEGRYEEKSQCCEKCKENPPSGDNYCTAKGCKCHSPQATEGEKIAGEEIRAGKLVYEKDGKFYNSTPSPDSWEGKFAKLARDYADAVYLVSEESHDEKEEDDALFILKSFIAKKIEEANYKGFDAGGQTKGGTGRIMYQRGQMEERQRVIEALQNICNKVKTDQGLSRAIANYILTLKSND